WRLAEWLIDAKQDPTAYITTSKDALDHSVALDKTFWVSYAIHGEVELVTARWEILNGKSPEAEFRNALDWLERARNSTENHDIYEIWYSNVRVYKCWAEWKLQFKRSADQEIRFAQDNAARAQKANPRSGEMMALRGVLFLLQARSTS